MKFKRIDAPFSDKQVEALNSYQKEGGFHPFTCCGFDGCNRKENSDGVLIATKEGLVCPCGKYTQNWAHEFMTD